MGYRGMARPRLTVFAVAIALGCSSDTGRITAARGLAATGRNNDANPVMHSVTGHWEVIGGSGFLNKVSVSAIMREDSTVSGQAQYEQFTDDGKSILAHGNIVCMGIDGNVARLGAVGENKLSDTPDAPIAVIMTVIDNGEGDNDPPDQGSSVLGVSSERRADMHCNPPADANPPIPLPLGLVKPDKMFWSEGGNIQVR